MWFHIAREYTERWHHQQQIRQAVGAPLLTDPVYFAPVLATFVHALPRTYEPLGALSGTIIRLDIQGDSGGTWFVVRDDDAWRLETGVPRKADARLIINQTDAWRVFTKTISAAEALPRVKTEGDGALALHALSAVSIIA